MSESDPIGIPPSEDEASERTVPQIPNLDSQLPEMDDLTERFSQQQVMISQLKEMVIAEEAARNQKIANSRLKMEKCASQLARIRDRAKMTKLKNAPNTSPVSKTQRETSLPSVSHEEQITITSDADLSSDILTSPDISITDISTATSSTTPGLPQKQDIGIRPKSKTPSREVTKILHQQIKEHKAMIAERAKNEKELEQALAKIQKQLEDGQKQSTELPQLGQAMIKLDIPKATNIENSADNSKVVSELKNKIIQLDSTILDLLETCKEKDSVIDSKTKAITLMSADLSKKGKNTLDLLDDTKEQMQQMQENFAIMESNMKVEKQQILSELEVSKNRINYLEEANSILESERFQLSIDNSNLEESLVEKEKDLNKLKSEITENLQHIDQLKSKLDASSATATEAREEKGIVEVSEMNDLTEKIEILEKLNLVLRQSNIELTEKLTTTFLPEKEPSPSPSKKLYQEDASKQGKKVTKQITKGKGAQRFKSQPLSKTEIQSKPAEEKDVTKEFQNTIKNLELMIQSLNKQVLEKEIVIAQKENENQVLKESLLDSEVSKNGDKFKEITDPDPVVTHPVTETIDEVPSQIETESVPLDSSSSDIVKHDAELDSLGGKLEGALNQIEMLSKELADANKNMIKVKSSHKAKLKQMQKSIDDFSKVSDTNTEVVRLQGEVSLLTQRVAELEEDKGNLQLHLVDYDSGRVSDSQLHAKLLEIESIAEDRLKAITDLETQKFDLVQELHSVKQEISVLEDKVSDLTFFENEHVSTEIKSVQLEEQVDLLKNKQLAASQEIAALKLAKDEMLSNIEVLQKDKSEINNKLEYYLQENIELIDRLDKLNAEKVSSAESIEMVESLTSQEKMEIEQYNKTFDSPHHEDKKDITITSEICDEPVRRHSFTNSNFETLEVPSKMQYSTEETVDEKIDLLKTENENLRINFDILLKDKSLLEENNELLKKEKDEVISCLRDETSKIDNMTNRIETLSEEKRVIEDQLKQLMENKSVRTEEVIVSETVEVEDTIEKAFVESPPGSVESQHLALKPEEEKEVCEVKALAEKAPKTSAAKTNKNATKEILRLKNLIKHQESEINNLNAQLANIEELKLEKDNLIRNQSDLENNLQKLSMDNNTLNDELLNMKEEKDNYNQQVIALQKYNDELLQEQQNILKTRPVEDPAEKLKLVEELKQKEEMIIQHTILLEEQRASITSLNEDVMSKDKEISECCDQIKKLDAGSKILKSTLTQYEEEQSLSLLNADLIRNLESNIVQLQNVILDNGNQISDLESKLVESNDAVNLLKHQLADLQRDIRDTNDVLNDTKKEMNTIIKQRDDNKQEITRLLSESTGKDEEINEVKLQLRRESIGYDKLKNNLQSIESDKESLKSQLFEFQEKCLEQQAIISKQHEEYSTLDTKFKEQFEKLKKFAANFKKKSTLCTELETKLETLSKDLETQVRLNEEADLKTQIMHQELVLVKSDYNQAKSEVQQASSTYQNLEVLQRQIFDMTQQLVSAQQSSDMAQAHVMQSEAENHKLANENGSLKTLIADYEHKMDHLNQENKAQNSKMQEISEKQNANAKNVMTQLSCLEEEIQIKKSEVTNLVEKLEEVQSNYDKYKCGHEAKIQERDVYIESLQSELLRHKDRILRLEDSVSTMEERRSSLERKADCLVTKLHEKDKACSESSFHEDALEKRLAALIAHDELIQKQLQETQHENAELNEAVRSLSEFKKSLQSEFDVCRSDLLKFKNEAEHLHSVEEERCQEHERVVFLENELKRITLEYSEILKNKSAEYEFLESELHTQSKNTELQRRMSLEQHEKLEEQMIIQSQMLKELQSECDWLKGENENLTLQLSQSAKSLKDEKRSDDLASIELTNLQSELYDLSQILKQKDLEIQNYQQHALQLQMALSDQSSKASSSQDSENVAKLESLLKQKNQEIGILKHQFDSCFSQLTEVVDAEKILQSSYLQLNKSLEEKDAFIGKLQNELIQLHGQHQNLLTSKDSAQTVPLVTEFKEKPIEPETVKQVSFNLMDRFTANKGSDSESVFDAIALKSLEDQIVSFDSMDTTSLGKNVDSMIRGFEHDLPVPVEVSLLENRMGADEPVVEDVIQPKSTYLCFDDKEVSQSELEGDNVFTEDDGWGWSSRDAQLEEEHLQTQISQNTETPTHCKITELESTIKFMTEENNKLSSELTLIQQKMMKALKKLKEFKLKNDSLTNDLKKLKTSTEVNMLDMAIQDELAGQIKALEDQINEMTALSNKDKVEKESLLKRIDVLISANDRLMEMKEKQDIEMEICLSKNRGLNDKIKNLEWGEDFHEHEEIPANKGSAAHELPISEDTYEIIGDLNDKIKDLEADNEELQAMLEEHVARNSSKKALDYADENIPKVPILEFEALKNDNAELKKSIEKMILIKNEQDAQLKTATERNEELKLNITQNIKFKEENDSYKAENADLKTKLEDLVREYYGFQEMYNKLIADDDELSLKNTNLEKEKMELENKHKDVCEREVACKSELIKIEYEKEEAIERCEQLVKKLSEKNEPDDSEQVINLTDQLQKYNQDLDLKNAELISITQERNTVLDEKILLKQSVEKLNQENAELLHSLAESRSSMSEATIQLSESWKQHLSYRESEFQDMEQRLQQEIQDLQFKLNSNQVESLNVMSAAESHADTGDTLKLLNETKKRLDEAVVDKDKYKDLCENELPMALEKCEKLLQDNENQTKALSEKESEIMALNNMLVEIKGLSAEHSMKSNETSQLQAIVQSKNEELQKCITLIQEMESNFNSKMNEYSMLVSSKESELSIKSQENLAMLQKLDDCEYLRQQINILEVKLSDTDQECDAELAGMRLKLHEERNSYEHTIFELNTQIKSLESQLEIKINENKDLTLKINELTTLVDEESAQLIELRSILETQEIEIVTLKENLVTHAEEYEIAVQHHAQEKSRLKAERHVSFADDTKPGADYSDNRISTTPSATKSDTLPRADLDLALYMLHQRDVRCEELTVELMQLLEERDTLQLKLSNAIRSIEDMRSKRSPSLIKIPDTKTDVPPLPLPSGSVTDDQQMERLPSAELDSSSAPSVTLNLDDDPPLDEKSLETKISQLHTVGHTRDVTLRDEREVRQRQMELLHRDVQHLPPEAAARLRETHYTLTRDTQSTSTVLMNWLWGRTTPKVVHM